MESIYVKTLTQSDYNKSNEWCDSLCQLSNEELISAIDKYGEEYKSKVGGELTEKEVSGEFARESFKDYIIVGYVNVMGDDSFDLYKVCND